MELFIVILLLAAALLVVGLRMRSACRGGDSCSGCSCQDSCKDKPAEAGTELDKPENHDRTPPPEK